jgi:hypothetical protein
VLIWINEESPAADTVYWRGEQEASPVIGQVPLAGKRQSHSTAPAPPCGSDNFQRKPVIG